MTLKMHRRHKQRQLPHNSRAHPSQLLEPVLPTDEHLLMVPQPCSLQVYAARCHRCEQIIHQAQKCHSGVMHTWGCTHEHIPERSCLSRDKVSEDAVLLAAPSSLCLTLSSLWQLYCFLPHVRGPWWLLTFLMQRQRICMFTQTCNILHYQA